MTTLRTRELPRADITRVKLARARESLRRHKGIVRNEEMTVRGNSARESIHSTVHRDILFKQLWQRPTSKGRQEVVHSAGTLIPCRVSRKLLLEEHKLSMQLEQIERERKLFLNKNNQEKYMLQLSVSRNTRTSENRKDSKQSLVTNENSRCNVSPWDDKNATDGNEKPRKAWSATTNGVYYPSGAKCVKQLQVKKVCLMKKMSERHHMTNALPWKRNFDMPQVPPPSRSASKMNIIWVRVRNSSGEMEIEGSLKANKNIQNISAKSDKNKVQTTIETTRAEDLKVITDQNKAFEKTFEKNYWLNEEPEKQTKLAWVYEQAPDSTERFNTQLAPTVKSLKVSPKETRPKSVQRRKSEEKLKSDKYQNGETNGTSRRSTDEDIRQHFEGGRPKTVSGRSASARNSQKTEDGRKTIGGDRQKIGNDRSLKNVASDRNDFVGDRQKPTDGKSIKKVRTRRRKATEIDKRKSGQKFVQTKPKVQGIGVFRKTFNPRVSNGKTKVGKKKSLRKAESMKSVSKHRSTSCINDKKLSTTKLPRKSCSACIVQVSKDDERLRGAKPDNSPRGKAFDQAAGLEKRERSALNQSKKSHSPVPIELPSQTQLESFDKVAKIRLRQSLAVKMRRHYYTGAWAFSPTHLGTSEKNTDVYNDGSIT